MKDDTSLKTSAWTGSPRMTLSAVLAALLTLALSLLGLASPAQAVTPVRAKGYHGAFQKRHRRRPMTWAACLAALAVLAGAVSATPAQAVTGYHVLVGSLGVTARSGPGTGFAAEGKLYNGQQIDIACQTKGSLVGVGLPGTPTDVWDRLSTGLYITDYYTSTTGLNGSYTPGIPQCGAAAPPPPPATPPAAKPYKVLANSAAVGKLFGSLNGKVLGDGYILPYPSAGCSSGWEVRTTNSTSFVLYIPTTGNVTASRVDFGHADSNYLLPGQTAFYCVGFSRINEVFMVTHNVNDGRARTMDGILLVTGALGFPTNASIELSGLLSRVASIPAMTRIGACIAKSCAFNAIQAFWNDPQSMQAFERELATYSGSLGKAQSLQWISSHLRQGLLSVITTSWWVVKFSGQSAFSPTGYMEFDTAPV